MNTDCLGVGTQSGIEAGGHALTHASTTPDGLARWLAAGEGHHLEFKEAKQRFDFTELVGYCVALVNEGGGQLVLGVTDRPRRVVGTQAFDPSRRTDLEAEAGRASRVSAAVPAGWHVQGRGGRRGS